MYPLGFRVKGSGLIVYIRKQLGFRDLGFRVKS